MPDTRPPAPEIITLADFVEQAARLAGGVENLRRRMGVSQESIDDMRVSDTPMLGADATALIEVFGLATPAAPDPSA